MRSLAPALGLALTLALGACTSHWAYLDKKQTESEGGGGSGSGGGGSTTGGNGAVGGGSSSGGLPAVGTGGASGTAGDANMGAGGASGGEGVSGEGGVGASSGTGAGGAADAGAGGGVSEPPFVTYDADDPNLQYTGRVDFSTPKSPRFSAGVAQVRARFTGTALNVLLSDEFRYGTSRDYFDVVIDGDSRTKLTPEPGRTEYEVATALSAGEHSVTLVKRTEASIGKSRFLGLAVRGELLAPAPRPEHRLEFIGDSISCGSGNEALNGSKDCEADGWGQPYQSGDFAFGPVLARALDAEYQVTAVSGIGLVRNYSSLYDARPMPAVYDLLYTEDVGSPLWDRTRFVPDAIVVALGTNDFSPGDNPPENPRPHLSVDAFTSAYIAFVDTLRGYYPAAHIFCVSSPMLGDGWPTSSDTFLSDQKNALSNVVLHYEGLDETRVHKFFVTKQAGRGCGTHPDLAQHAQLAREIGDYVKSVLEW